MRYSKDFVEEALTLMMFDGLTVQHAKEPGMPGSGSDPRKANDPHVMMIDVRRAWEECEYLSLEHQQALLAYSMVGTWALAEMVTGVPSHILDRRREEGLGLMCIWLNSTYVDREVWAEELEAIELQRAAESRGLAAAI